MVYSPAYWVPSSFFWQQNHLGWTRVDDSPQPEEDGSGTRNHSILKNTPPSSQQKEREWEEGIGRSRKTPLRGDYAARKKMKHTETLQSQNADAADIIPTGVRPLQQSERIRFHWNCRFRFRRWIWCPPCRMLRAARCSLLMLISSAIFPGGPAVNECRSEKRRQKMRRTQTRRPAKICRLTQSAEKVFWHGCRVWKMAGGGPAVLWHIQARLLPAGSRHTRNERNTRVWNNRSSPVI